MSDWILVTDFDGTIVNEDLAELILRRFGRKGWEKYDTLAVEGKMKIEDCLRIQFEMIEASEEEILDLVRNNCRLRSGFKELLATCKDKEVPIVIATAGIDFCI